MVLLVFLVPAAGTADTLFVLLDVVVIVHFGVVVAIVVGGTFFSTVHGTQIEQYEYCEWDETVVEDLKHLGFEFFVP